MQVVTWNLAKRAGSVDGVGGALAELRPDLLLLQSVTQAMLEKLRAPLQMLALRFVSSSIDEARAAGKHSGNVVASRWRCEHVPAGWAGRESRGRSWVQRYNRLGIERPPWNGLAPKPWRLLRVRLDSPWGFVDVFNVNVPAQSRNRWDKVKTMDALASSVEASPIGLRLLGGDLATPRKETPDGVRGYGAGAPARGKLWDEAELSLIVPDARHGLSDAFRALHPVAAAADAASCLVDGAGLRRFDHLLVSRQFIPQEAAYRHDWMDTPSARLLSNHAPLSASFEVRLLPVGPGYSLPPPSLRPPPRA